MLSYLCFHRGIDSTLRSAFIESATDQHGVVEVNSCFCDELSLLITHCSIQTDFTIPQKLCANAEFSHRHLVGLALGRPSHELILHALVKRRVLAAAGRACVHDVHVR